MRHDDDDYCIGSDFLVVLHTSCTVHLDLRDTKKNEPMAVSMQSSSRSVGL